MSKLIKFNLSDSKSVRALENYSHYRRLHGFLIANKWGLPVSQEGFLITDIYSDLEEIINDKDYCVVMCRPDAPIEKGKNLPRGRDLPPGAILAFLSEIRNICKEAIIIAFKHPSIELLGVYVPRYKTSGAAVTLINIRENIIIDYVGPGFDAGDITRGKTVHSSILIPWDQRYIKPDQILRQARITESIYQISDENYTLSREDRITDLLQLLGEKHYEEIEGAIPLSTPKVTPTLLANIYNIYKDCVDKPFYVDSKYLGNRFAILINMYGHKMHVFEVYLPQRDIASGKGI